MANETVMKWEFSIEDDDKLRIELNGGVNRILEINHERYKENLKEVYDQIEFYRPFTKTTVIGLEKLTLL